MEENTNTSTNVNEANDQDAIEAHQRLDGLTSTIDKVDAAMNRLTKAVEAYAAQQTGDRPASIEDADTGQPDTDDDGDPGDNTTVSNTKDSRDIRLLVDEVRLITTFVNDLTDASSTLAQVWDSNRTVEPNPEMFEDARDAAYGIADASTAIRGLLDRLETGPLNGMQRPPSTTKTSKARASERIIDLSEAKGSARTSRGNVVHLTNKLVPSAGGAMVFRSGRQLINLVDREQWSEDPDGLGSWIDGFHDGYVCGPNEIKSISGTHLKTLPPAPRTRIAADDVPSIGMDDIIVKISEVGPRMLGHLVEHYRMLSEYQDATRFFHETLNELEPYRAEADRQDWLEGFDDTTGVTACRKVLRAFLPAVRAFVGDDDSDLLLIDEVGACIRADIANGGIGTLLGEGLDTADLVLALDDIGSVLEHSVASIRASAVSEAAAANRAA